MSGPSTRLRSKRKANEDASIPDLLPPAPKRKTKQKGKKSSAVAAAAAAAAGELCRLHNRARC
jgi:hypothetical protein